MEVFKESDAKIRPRDKRDDHDKKSKGENSHNEFALSCIFRNGFKVDSFKGWSDNGIVFIFASFDFFSVVHSVDDGGNKHKNEDDTLNPKDTTKLDIGSTSGDAGWEWVDSGG